MGNNEEAQELVDEAKDNYANATNNYEMLGKTGSFPSRGVIINELMNTNLQIHS